MSKYLVCALLVLAVGGFLSFRRWTWKAAVQRQIAAAQQWPEANARVDSTDLQDMTTTSAALLNLLMTVVSRQHLTAQPTMMIAYRFEVGGHIYQGNRLAFGRLKAPWAYARQVLGRYPKGSVMRIRYNPQDPRDNVVEPRELAPSLFHAIIGPMVMGLGAILVVIELARGR